jgi:hypothetical protein
MRFKVNALLPCVTFFAAGRVATGVGTLLMQATLVLWPVAVRMARDFSEGHAVDRMLNQLSTTYQLPAHVVLGRPNSKRFRPAKALEAA